MSKDIRSFFTVVSKKSSSTPSSKTSKKPVVLVDSDEEEVERTPENVKVKSKAKCKIQVINSDSEDEARTSQATKPKLVIKKELKTKLKPVNLDSLNVTIKQSEVVPIDSYNDDAVMKESKLRIDQKEKKKHKIKKTVDSSAHKDYKFEKALDDLDQDSDDTILLDNLDILDKTLEQALETDDVNGTQSNQMEICIKPAKEDVVHHRESLLDKADVEKNISTPKRAEKRQRKKSESSSKSNKKQKLEQTDSGLDPDFDKLQRKRHSTDLYVAYLHRGGPKHHGEKEYPKGKPDCLKGLTFLRTGVLDSLEGEEFGNLVKDHGGRVVSSVSKKIDYLVVGDEPGPAKIEKATQYNLPQISEDQFLDLILVKSGKSPMYAVSRPHSEDLGFEGSPTSHGSQKSDKSNQNNTDSGNKEIELKTDVSAKPTEKIENGSNKKVKKPSPEKLKVSDSTKKLTQNESENKIKHSRMAESVQNKESPECHNLNNKVSHSSKKELTDNLVWTEKYKPSNIKAIIGQQDSNSNMNKLIRWLENWFKNASPAVRKKIPKPGPYNQMDGAYYKAALLSGPPGVGKTTTASLVAKALGFDIVEFNASDTRNKKLIHEEISNMMQSKTLAGFKTGVSLNQKRVLLMDEVDGMAGNEDRGGIAELINFIKTAQFPIICMCNNRDLPKMRSLVNCCFGLKFNKPSIMQVKGAMLSICYKEGLNIKPDALAELIAGTGCDIRQTLNHLSMWSVAEKNLSIETVKKESQNSQKDVVLGVWDMIRKVFNKSENKDMSLVDKARLFFYDYSFGPMFVLENYINVTPDCTGPTNKKSMETFIRRQLTADCLSRSDLIESKIRSTNNWSLLESQAYLSTVLPSYYLSGIMGQVRFPGWFGKNSQRNKNLRMIGEIYSHARTTITGGKTSVRLDYVEPLTSKLLMPLIKQKAEGIDETLEIMKSYSLLREDLTNLCDLMTCFKNRYNNPFDQVASNVKSALTRKYNKVMVLSIAPPTASKKNKVNKGEGYDLFGEDEEFSDEEANDDDNIDDDGLIKVKTKDSAKAGSSKSSSQKEKKPRRKAGQNNDSKSKGKSK